MRRLARTLVIPVVVLSSVPATALANDRAGVVTSAEGRVSVARASAPAANPLKFKDEVFLRDRVSTGVDSLARLLLGGKAVITVREHSSVTITEVPGKSIIEVSTGRMALSVARERMKTGESIEVRTPNAVASVRGTVLVTEVSGAGEAVASAFTVVRGRVDVSQLGPQNLPVGTVVSLGAMQTAGVSNAQGVGAAQPITPQALQRLSADFSVKVIPPPAAVTAGLVSQGQVGHAVTHTSAILQTTREGAPSQGVSGRADSRPGEADKGSGRGKSDERGGPGTAKLIVAPVAPSVVRAGGATPSSDLSLGRRINDKIQKDTVPVSQAGKSSASNGGAASSSSGGNSGGGGSSTSANAGGSSSSVASNAGGGSGSSAGKSENAGGNGNGGSSAQGNGNDDKGKSANARGRVKR